LSQEKETCNGTTLEVVHELSVCALNTDFAISPMLLGIAFLLGVRNSFVLAMRRSAERLLVDIEWLPTCPCSAAE
jgi:hypothetical protein